MYIVSGCPRSGTSLMMNIMRESLGEERLIGYQSPAERKARQQAIKNAALQENENAPEIVKYIRQKRSTPNKEEQRRQRRAKKMNPDGFWEMAFTVKGVYYKPEFEKLLNEILTETNKRFCKIVSQGLAKSDPRYIDKIIYMARDPRAVAKSQEQLGRNNPMDPENAPRVNGQAQLIRSVMMYNQVTVAAAGWLKAHPSVPVHIVNYDLVLDDTANELQKIQDFLGEGDFSKGAKLVKQDLRRSEPSEEGVADNLQMAIEFHEMVLLKDWQGILDRAQEERAKPKMPQSIYCVRLGSPVNYGICNICRIKNHKETIENFVQSANSNCIDWRNEPCAYECSNFSEVGEPLSVAGSIANNHWTPIGGMGCKFAERTEQQAVQNQPCAGKTVMCHNPDCPIDKIPSKNCNKFKCVFYTEQE